MADLVNRNVTLWWRTDYSDLANVYTLHDYFMSTDMIRVAIDRNIQLAQYKGSNTGGGNSGSITVFTPFVTLILICQVIIRLK